MSTLGMLATHKERCACSEDRKGCDLKIDGELGVTEGAVVAALPARKSGKNGGAVLLEMPQNRSAWLTTRSGARNLETI